MLIETISLPLALLHSIISSFRSVAHSPSWNASVVNWNKSDSFLSNSSKYSQINWPMKLLKREHQRWAPSSYNSDSGSPILSPVSLYEVIKFINQKQRTHTFCWKFSKEKPGLFHSKKTHAHSQSKTNAKNIMKNESNCINRLHIVFYAFVYQFSHWHAARRNAFVFKFSWRAWHAHVRWLCHTIYINYYQIKIQTENILIYIRLSCVGRESLLRVRVHCTHCEYVVFDFVFNQKFSSPMCFKYR